MTNCNFLSKSSSRSCGHSSVTLALTVGSPSAHRRGAMLRLLSVLVLILTIGVGNVWADYTITFKTSGTTNLINSGGDYATSSETAYVNGSSSGVQFGSGNNGGNIVLTMTQSGQISASKITLNGYCKFASKGGDCKVTITFTDNTSENHTPTATTTATNTDVTITNNTKTLKSIKLESTGSNKRFYVTGVTVVAAAAPADPVDPTITPTNGEVEVDGELDVSTLFESNSTGAMTYSITAGDSYASLSGSTLTGTAVGSVTIQASQAAVTGFNAKTATCTVNVIPALSKITITQSEVASFTDTYAQYSWNAGGVSGKVYAYKSGGIQFNSGKTGYYIYNTDPIPGKIRKITMTKASGTTRTWTPYVSTTALTATDLEKALTSKEVASTTTWNVTGDNTYFYLTLTGGATVIGSIVISYESCTELGQINGSFYETHPTSVVLKWDKNSNYENWAVTGSGTIGEIETTTISAVDYWTCEVTGLSCNTEYEFTVTADPVNNSGYCDGSWKISDTTSKFSIEKANSGTVKDGENNTIGTFAVTGNLTEACNTTAVSLTYEVTNAGYQFKEWNVHKNNDASTKVTVTNNQFSMPAYDVVVDLELEEISNPTLTPSVDAVNFGNQEISTTSSAQTISISGANLQGGVAFEITGTDASAFAVTSPATSPIAQANAEAQGGQSVQITFTPSGAKVHSATLRFTSTNATTRDVTLSGTGVNLYTVTFDKGTGVCATSSLKQGSLDANVTLPSATASEACGLEEWDFAGWCASKIETATESEPTLLATNASYKPTDNVTLYAVYKRGEDGEVSDVITRSTTGLPDQTGDNPSYSEWSGKTVTSSAVYAGQSADAPNYIQMRSKNSNSGIITTTSGGKAKKVTIDWESTTANGKVLNIYGKNTAYSAASDLYSEVEANSGSLLGTIVYGTSTVLDITGDYEYIGLRSNDGAIYLNSVTIEWNGSSTTYHSIPSCTGKVTMTYDANGGENAPAAVEYDIDDDPVVAGAGSMSLAGHTFVNWNTKANGEGTTYAAGATITDIKKDMTLYAIWTANKHTVSVSAVDNGTITATPTGASAITEGNNNTEVAYGTVVTLAQENDTHYTFGGWIVTAGGNAVEVTNNQFTMPDADVTVSATFTENAKRTVKYYNNGGDPISSEAVYVGEAPTNVPTPVYDDCLEGSSSFYGWATAEWAGAINATTLAGKTVHTGNLPNVEEGEGDIEYYAVWAKANKANTFNLLSDANDFVSGADYLIASYASSKDWKLKAENYNSNTNQQVATQVTIGDNYEETDGKYIWTITNEGGNSVSIYNAETKKYLAISSSNLVLQDAKATFTKSVTDGGNNSDHFEFGVSSRYVNFYDSSNPYYNAYTSQDGALYLYLRDVTHSEFRTNCCGLKPVTNVQVGTIGETSIELTWTAPTSKTGINKYQIVDAEHEIAQDVTDVDATSATVTGLTECTTYNFKVVSVGDDCSSNSNEVEATPFAGAKVVTFDYNGGSGATTSASTSCGVATVNLPTPNARDGYNFTGWNDGTQTLAPSTATYTPAATMTLTAQWSEIAKTHIVFSVNGNTNVVAAVDALQDQEYELTQTTDPINGYTFVGWAESEEEEDVETELTTIESYTPAVNEESKTLYAVFKRTENNPNKKYTLDYANEEALASSTSWGSYGTAYAYTASDGSAWTVKAYKNNGMQINTGKDCSIKIPDCPANIVSIKVTCGAKAVGLSASDYSGSGTITYIVSGTDATSQTLDFTGKSVKGGYLVPKGGSTVVTKIEVEYDGTKIYYTTAPAAVYDVEYALGGGAWKEYEGCEDTKVKDGHTYTICEDEPIRDHFNFVEWQVGGVAKTGEITISKDTTITAVWEAKAESNVTYKAGTGTGSDIVVEDVEEGTEVTLKAIGSGEGQANFTKSGYDFVGWLRGDVLYKAGETFNMPTTEVTLTAQWKKQNVVKMSLITDASQLMNGMEVIFGYIDGDNANNSAVNGDIEGSNKYFTSVTSNVTFNNDNTVTFGSGAMVLTIEKADNGWKLRKNATNYLTNSTDNLSWGTKDNATTWTISFEDNNAKIATGSVWIQYNSSSPRFKTYSSTQKAIRLYGKATVVNSSTSISEIGYVDGDVIVLNNNAALTVDANIAPTTVIVPSGSTVTVNDNKTVDANTVIVENGGTLNIADEGTVNTAETLIIHSTLGKGTGTGSGSGNNPGTCGQITNGDNITVNGDVWIEIELTQESEASYGWYAFSVPFRVDAMHGVYGKPDGQDWQELQNEVGYAIMSYHGDVRAQGLYGWKKYRDIMEPGTLYIIAVGKTEYKTLRFKKVANANLVSSSTVTLNKYGSETSTDAGWNGIGNPNLQISNYATGNGSPTGAYIQFLDHSANAFKNRQRNNVNLVVGSAFFFQYTGESEQTNITINKGAQAGENNGYLAPKRERNAAEETIYEVELTNVATGEQEDNIFLTAREEAQNMYEIGRDVAKMSMGDAKCAQMWVPAYGTQLCAADFQLVNDRAEYPLTINAPQAGTYSISTVANENADLYLTYEGAIIWNLSMGAYEIELTKGTTSGYGIVLQAKAPNSATGVDEVTGDKVQCTKVVIDDHVYILRGEQLYGIDGKMVK